MILLGLHVWTEWVTIKSFLSPRRNIFSFSLPFVYREGRIFYLYFLTLMRYVLRFYLSPEASSLVDPLSIYISLFSPLFLLLATC